MQKGFSVVLILGVLAAVVLIGAGIGGYLVFVKKPPAPQIPVNNISATTSSVQSIAPSSSIDTSTWKTYRNDKYGFGFKYPGEWKLDKFNNESAFLYSPQTARDLSSPEAADIPPDISLKVNNNRQHIDAKLYGLQANDNWYEIKKYTTNPLNIDGHQSFEFTAPAGVFVAPFKEIDIDDGVYVITFSMADYYRSGETDAIANTLNQILSTLKFTPTP